MKDPGFIRPYTGDDIGVSKPSVETTSVKSVLVWPNHMQVALSSALISTRGVERPLYVRIMLKILPHPNTIMDTPCPLLLMMWLNVVILPELGRFMFAVYLYDAMLTISLSCLLCI